MSNTNSLKPQYGWTVSVFLPIIPFFAKKFTKHGISANFVSWLSLIVFFIGLIPFYFFHDFILVRLFSVFCFILGTFLDVLDGAVARYQNKSSKFGSFLDTVIDLIRYDFYFLVIYFLYDFTKIDILALFLYVFLLNFSFINFLLKLFKNKKITKSVDFWERVIPKAYKEFCLKYKLLYNPFNLEDQLLFFFFIIGSLFKIELIILYIAVITRCLELSFIIFFKIIKRNKNE